MHRRTRQFFIAAVVIAVASALTAGATFAATPTASNQGIDAKTVKYVKPNTMIGPAGTGLTRGITSTSVKVGCVYDPAYAFAANGLKAYFTRSNKTKIFGRTVNLQPCVQLSLTDPAGALTATQKMVEQDGDFAIFAFCSGAECNQPQATYLIQNQVPTFGNGTIQATCGSRWGFGAGGCSAPGIVTPAIPKQTYGESLLPALEAAATDMKVSKANGKAGAAGTGTSAASMNVASQTLTTSKDKFKTSEPAVALPATAGADLGPFAHTINDNGVNLLAVTSGVQTVSPLLAALKSAGYTGAVSDAGSAYIPGLTATQPAQAAALNGLYSYLFDIVPFESQTPYTKQLVKDAKAVGQTPATLGNSGSQAYYSAEMFTQMLKASGKNLNTKTFDTAVNGGKFVYTPALAGGPGTVPFPAGHFTATNCNTVVQNVNGTYRVIASFECHPNLPPVQGS